jgi:hypothetical protein
MTWLLQPSRTHLSVWTARKASRQRTTRARRRRQSQLLKHRSLASTRRVSTRPSGTMIRPTACRTPKDGNAPTLDISCVHPAKYVTSASHAEVCQLHVLKKGLALCLLVFPLARGVHSALERATLALPLRVSGKHTMYRRGHRSTKRSSPRVSATPNRVLERWVASTILGLLGDIGSRFNVPFLIKRWLPLPRQSKSSVYIHEVFVRRHDVPVRRGSAGSQGAGSTGSVWARS